jgi:hypothetical protein
VLAAALALIVIGLLLIPFTSFFSLIVSVIGLVLLVVWLVGLMRRRAAGPV